MPGSQDGSNVRQVRQNKAKVGSGFVLLSEVRSGKSSRHKCEWNRNHRKGLKQSRQVAVLSL